MKPSPWKSISSAPTDRSIILGVADSFVPNYIGRFRFGNLGEPQPHEQAWRCDSSGRFAQPTHWMEAPDQPGGSH